MTEQDGGSPGRSGRGTPPAWLRRNRGFPGDPEQVRQARHWVREHLPGCPPLDDVIEIVSELAANAVTHTRSRDSGGRFDVELVWFPGLLRVIVGDQGAPFAPRLIEKAGDTGGRGLLIVDRLSRAWGIAGDPVGRWVWADILWSDCPPAPASADGASAADELVRLRRAYAGVSVWYGRASGLWWAAFAGAWHSGELMISAPSPGALDCMLARRNIRIPLPPAPHIPAGARLTGLPGARDAR